MKIVMNGNFGMSLGQICDENHIKDAFEQLGHTVKTNVSDEQSLKECDFILTFKSQKVGVKDIQDWKNKTHSPIFIWSFDRMDRFRWFYPIAKECSLWLGEEEGFMDRWKKEGLPFYWFPNHSCPPRYFHPVENVEKIYPVSFTGTPYNNSENDKFKILNAVQEKFDLHVFGINPDGWRNQGIKNVYKAAFDEESSKIISQSKIMLAISNCRVPGYWSIRSSQIMMCGGFGLVRYTPLAEKEMKDNVVYWDNVLDLLEKIDYYLKHDEEREEIARKAHEYAMQNLTVVQRVKELLIVVEMFKKNKVLFL